MSCRKCGYRFLWELIDRKEGENICPCCYSTRPWDDKEWEGPDGTDLRRWYQNQKTNPRIANRKYNKLSTSHDIGYKAGEPRIYELSTSFTELKVGEKISEGWRPWSKIQTYKTSEQCLPLNSFDRTYSRAYNRNYSRPYNVAEEAKDFSYPTAYSGKNRLSRFNTPGSNREILERENRDYKGRIQPSYQVKSYHRRVVKEGSIL
eukprot:TRINITY_DN946_c0_g1_i1.p1 TRINITY_DN946_c0_g1~~TRINITY_DN946_c0_g1_i1.p1  ORF type:complete len:205 (-),score=25.89 TRINITY_DN946_c0_g1_i1:163-777(-)